MPKEVQVSQILLDVDSQSAVALHYSSESKVILLAPPVIHLPLELARSEFRKPFCGIPIGQRSSLQGSVEALGYQAPWDVSVNTI